MKPRQIYLSIGALTGWFAIALSFYLLCGNSKLELPETMIRFFSAGTSLVNIVAALCFTFLLITPRSRIGKFFSKQKTLVAIAVYITSCLLVANFILHHSST